MRRGRPFGPAPVASRAEPLLRRALWLRHLDVATINDLRVVARKLRKRQAADHVIARILHFEPEPVRARPWLAAILDVHRPRVTSALPRSACERRLRSRHLI